MNKKLVIKVAGEFEVKDDVTLKQIADAVAEIQDKLREYGAGTIKLHVPRGSYAV
jgi:hypothetical protein